MRDKRRDSGEYYPGGRVIARPGTAPQQVVVQWSDVQGKPQVAPLPERYKDSDMKTKINEIASKFATMVVAAFVVWTACADVTVQKKRKDEIYNDELVVVDVSGEGVGINTNAVEKIANVAVVTNALTVATTNRVAALETATTNISSSVSGLQSSKLDGPTDPTLTKSGKAADAKSTGDALAGKAGTEDVELDTVYDWIDNGEGVIPPFVAVRNVGKPYHEEHPDPYVDGRWHIDFEISVDGSEFLASTYDSNVKDGRLDFGGFFKFTRSIIGYAMHGQPSKRIASVDSVNGKLSTSDVIDPAVSTTTGKAADALKVKEALAEKRGITDLKNYPETVRVLAERLPVVLNVDTYSNIRVLTDGPFYFEDSKYRVCGDVPEYQDITICELDAKGRYVAGSGATFGGVVPTIGMQIACGGETSVSDGDTLALKSDIPAPYTPPPYLRAYDEVRKCWWRGRMVNGVINWEVE